MWCGSREKWGGELAGSTCGRPVNSGYQRREKKGERIGGGYCVCNEGRRELCSLLSYGSLLVGGKCLQHALTEFIQASARPRLPSLMGACTCSVHQSPERQALAEAWSMCVWT